MIPIITINALGCGAGKTTTDIFPRVRRLLSRDEHVIIVVPSILMIDEYTEHLPSAHTIYSNIGNVDERLTQAIAYRKNLIIITHAAFLQHVWTRLDRAAYHLIIDEAFDPFKFVTYAVDSTKEVQNQFVLSKEKMLGGWFPVSSPVYRDHTAYKESTSYRDLINANWSLWQSEDDNEKLHQGLQSEFGLVLRKEAVFAEWRSIHICAANFEVTFLAHWFKSEDVTLMVEHQFEPHTNADINWHSFDFKWSKTLRNKSPQLHVQYRDYINNHSHEPIIAIRNNDAGIRLINEERLSHNCHGLNKFTKFNRISIESSLNVRSEQNVWIQDLLSITSDQILHARTTYLSYQVIMRSAMRLHKRIKDPVQIYVCDQTVMTQLTDYFDCGMTHSIIPNTNVVKPLPLTNTERSRIRRAKLKSESMTKTTTEVKTSLNEVRTQNLVCNDFAYNTLDISLHDQNTFKGIIK